MHLSKSYLMLASLAVFMICSICGDEKSRKDESTIDWKKNVFGRPKDGLNRRKEKPFVNDDEEHDDIDERLAAIASAADNRNLPFNALENSYRTRGRWPTQSSSASSFSFPFDNLANGNDWSRLDLSSLLSSVLPVTSNDKNPVLTSATSCHSLVDAQYPIFSDVCGAVPQARYSLPNTFGHRERWQVAQVLSNLISSGSDSSCIRSLRLLICPVLFPPCRSQHEPPAVLPCQSYCRAVKARCSTPALELFHCGVLPQSSDLCPTTQSYGSFVPPDLLPSVKQQPPLADGFPLSKFPTSRSYSSLRSLLSGQGLQSPLTQASLPSVAQQLTGAMSLNNGVPSPLDTLTPLLADFSARSYANDPRQNSRNSPLTHSSFDTHRSMVETRSQTDAQSPNGPRPSAISSIVRA